MKETKDKWVSFKTERLKKEVSNISKNEAVADYKERKTEELKSSQKSDKSFNRISSLTEKAQGITTGEKTFSKKILRKPTVSIPRYSAVKAIKGLASSQGPLVREVERPEIVRDDRSLFFNSELNGEVKRNNSWLNR